VTGDGPPPIGYSIATVATAGLDPQS